MKQQYGPVRLRGADALLAARLENASAMRCLAASKLPRMKTLEEFDFAQSQQLGFIKSSTREGDYIERTEPLLLIGQPGTAA